MALSVVGQAQAAATSVTLPTTVAGDLIIIFAYRNATTAPTLPAGYTTIQTASANANSFRVGYKIAAGGDTSGTWTNANVVRAVVYRGSSGVGTSAGATNAASTTTGIPALTLGQTDGSSWVLAFAGSKQTTSQSTPAGLTVRGTSQAGTTSDTIGADTNGAVSSFSSHTSTAGASATGCGVSIEIMVATAAPANLVNSVVAFSAALNLGWNPTVGNLLVVGLTYNSVTAPTAPTDNQGNTYHLIQQAIDTAGGNTAAMYWTTVAVSSGTFTISTSEPVAGDIAVAEYSGITASSPLDQSNVANGNGTQPLVSVTTSTDNETYVVIEFDEGSSGNQQFGLNPFHLEGSDTNNSSHQRITISDYKNASHGTVQGGVAVGYGGAWAAVIASFKPTGGAAVTNSNFLAFM